MHPTDWRPIETAPGSGHEMWLRGPGLEPVIGVRGSVYREERRGTIPGWVALSDPAGKLRRYQEIEPTEWAPQHVEAAPPLPRAGALAWPAVAIMWVAMWVLIVTGRMGVPRRPQ